MKHFFIRHFYTSAVASGSPASACRRPSLVSSQVAIAGSRQKVEESSHGLPV